MVADRPSASKRQRRKARNQAVHGVVQTRRLVGDQPGRLAGRRIARASLRRDREREAADGGHRLAEFIVQLVRDQPPFLFDALVGERGHFAALLEPRLRVARLTLRQHLVFDRLRHAVERVADDLRLGTRRAAAA